MANRHRPRLNITVDPELKQRLKRTAKHLNVTVSRLLEEVAREFLRQYEEDPLIGQRLKKEIDEQKRTERKETEEERAREEIRRILEKLDEQDAAGS